MTKVETVLELWLERDLTAAARAGELRRAFEMDELVGQVADLVESGRHPMLVGDPGVGKTAVIHELVRRSLAGDGPEALAGHRVLQLSIRHRLSGLEKPEHIRAQMVKLTAELLDEACDVVSFFGDAHLAPTLGLLPQLLSLALRSRRPVLCEANRAIFSAMAEEVPDVLQRFDVVYLDEPGLEVTSRILAGWAEEERARSGVGYTDEALYEALSLAHRFLARARLPRAAIDLLRQSSATNREGDAVGAAHVRDRFCRHHRAPRVLVDPELRLDLDSLRRDFRAQVLGQEEATDAVVEMVGVMKSGLSDPRRPFGVFLFVGPTGVGKTHLAQLLAEYLFGRRDRIVRINMADFQSETDPRVLFGDPDDYQLVRRQGVLTARLAGHPFAVLLFDEFEKAHAKVHDRFLQLIDEGEFINGAGETVPVRSTVIVATCNEGAELYRGQSMGFAEPRQLDQLDREVDFRLEAKFRFELLNRFDRVVHFHPLDREHIRTIALRELEGLRERAGLKRTGLVLEVDESLLDWLTVHGYDPNYGARHLRRVLERHVATAVARRLVEDPPRPGDRLELTVRSGRVQTLLERRRRTRPELETVALPEGPADRSLRLDREQLLEERARLLAGAVPRIAELECRREERRRLLERMGASGFWDDAAQARRVLEEYRELDVAVRIEERLEQSLLRLDQLAERPGAPLAELARGLEAAASALHQWQELDAERGPASLWLMISQGDPLRPVGPWIEELAEMETRWCRRLGLAAEAVACELRGRDGAARIVLEVEGPGAATYLAMERGVHRRHRSDGRDLRAEIALVERTAERAGEALDPRADGVVGDQGAEHRPAEGRVQPLKRQRGPLEMELAWRARLAGAPRGVAWELLGTDRATLRRLLGDLVPWLEQPAPERSVARLYGVGGRGARDPRTGASAARLRDVLRGQLDPFLEGWRERRSEPVAALEEA